MGIAPFHSLSLNPPLQPDSIGSEEAVGSPTLGLFFEGGGTIYVGSIGANTPRATLYFPLSTSWDINANIYSFKTLTWDVGDLPNFWFRVMGDCQPVKCPTSPVEYPQRCESMFMTMVLATSPKEVCEKLARSNFVWRITEMSRFTTPASNAVAEQMDAAGLIDIDCNKLVPVPHCQYSECLPFCLGGDATIEMGMDMQVYDAFFQYEGTGGIHLSGSAGTSRPDSIVGSGGISMGGAADVKSSQYYGVGEGGIIISGAAGVTSTQYNVAGTGGITISGAASVTNTNFNAQGEGGMSMGGEASARVKLTFIASGLGSIGPSFAGIQISGQAGELAKYYFITAGEGGINIGGTGHTASSYFAGSGSGGIVLSGESFSISPNFHGVGSGGMVLGGEAATTPIITGVGSGGIAMGGEGVTALNLSYQGQGGIQLGGEALTNRFMGSGGIIMGGSAVIVSTWKGLYVDEWGMDAVCENLEPVFGSGDAPAYVPSSLRISGCGATDMPTTLQVSHNLNDSQVLTNFMYRNGFTLPPIFHLTYHRLTETWRGNYHFRGRADEATNDRWDFLVEWGCTSEAYGLATSPVWKFGFYILRKNDQTGIDFDTRILVYLDPEPLASRFKNDGINLEVALNPFTKIYTIPSANATIQSSAYYDGIGLFKEKIWRKQLFDFKLSAVGEFGKIPRYDIFPAFPKPGEYDVT